MGGGRSASSSLTQPTSVDITDTLGSGSVGRISAFRPVLRIPFETILTTVLACLSRASASPAHLWPVADRISTREGERESVAETDQTIPRAGRMAHLDMNDGTSR